MITDIMHELAYREKLLFTMSMVIVANKMTSKPAQETYLVTAVRSLLPTRSSAWAILSVMLKANRSWLFTYDFLVQKF